VGSPLSGPGDQDRAAIDGHRQFVGANVGVAFTIESGAPLTAMWPTRSRTPPGKRPIQF